MYYSGEPGGYCAMWSAAALKIYMETYRLTGKKYSFIEWMKEIHSSAETLEFDSGLVTLICNDLKSCGLRLRKWIQNEAAKLFEEGDEDKVNEQVYDFICRKTEDPSNEYVLRSFLNVYYRDPQSIFNIITPTFLRMNLAKITLKYFGEAREALNNISTRDDNDRILETELLNMLGSQSSDEIPAVGTSFVRDDITYHAMMWVSPDVDARGITRNVVWLIKVPEFPSKYLYNVGTSAPGYFLSLLYLEDAKTVRQVDVGHSNALMTIKYEDNSIAFRRFDPDYSPGVEKYSMVYIDGDGKWNTALAFGILNIFRFRGYNVTGNAQKSMGIKLFDVSSSGIFSGPQTLERDLPRLSGEFLGYCQIWTLRVLETAAVNFTSVDMGYKIMFDEILASTGYLTNRDSDNLRRGCRDYIRRQASRYVSAVVRQLFNCNQSQSSTLMEDSNP
jgi:hypothetical protein